MTTTLERKKNPMELGHGFHAERESGVWRIEHKTVGDDKLAATRALIGGGRWVPPGEYVGLRRGGTLVMSDTPDERRDHLQPFLEARRRGGRVLIHGLGLGMVLNAVLSLDNVEHVDVVEVSPEVIDLCGPAFRDHVTSGRLTIHNEDCMTKKWVSGSRWSVVWHDIWDYICSDNLDDMKRLHRSFGRRCEWQGSWARHLCERGY